jgi:hypothetical protein
MARSFVEDFTAGQAGFYGWVGNQEGPKPLEHLPAEDGGAVLSRSPWWIDYNHAPNPIGLGAGYLHMVYSYSTTGPIPELYAEVGGGRGGGEHTNAFVAGEFPTDFTDATITVRVRGEVANMNGAQLVLLVQGMVDGICSGYLLTGQPIAVTPEYQEVQIVCSADPSDWTPLGSRHDRTETYGVKPFRRLLASVDVNFMFVMFPLDVQPVSALYPPPVGLKVPAGGRDPALGYSAEEADMDGLGPSLLRPERDYPVRRELLPTGYVLLSRVQVDFPAPASSATPRL